MVRARTIIVFVTAPRATSSSSIRKSTSQGDVKKKPHEERSLLSDDWQAWNGSLDPKEAFSRLAINGSGDG